MIGFGNLGSERGGRERVRVVGMNREPVVREVVGMNR